MIVELKKVGVIPKSVVQVSISRWYAVAVVAAVALAAAVVAGVLAVAAAVVTV